MPKTKKITLGDYFSDLVNQEPNLLAERDARTTRILRKTLLIAAFLLVASALFYCFLGLWLGAAMNIASSAAIVVVQSMIKRGHLKRALHVVFWIAFFTIWSLLLWFAGPSHPLARVLHFWFILLAAVSYIGFGILGGRWQDCYAFLCGISFVAVHFDIFHFNVVFAPEQPGRQIGNIFMLLIVVGLVSILSWIFVNEIRNGEVRLDRVNGRLEELLENMLPHSIAIRLKSEGKTFADGFAEASILFAEIVGLGDFADRSSPDALVSALDQIFSQFDDLCEGHGVEKIKTAGGVYMVVAGIPEIRPDHAEVLARFALDILRAAREFDGLGIKIGINSGPVVAGVIGTNRLIYDLWGDSVNLAQRMQLHGVPGAIQVSRDTCRLLESKFTFQARGKIAVKGKGDIEAYLLTGEKADSAATLSGV